MRETLHFCVLGGDLRQVRLAELLCEDGHTVALLGFEGLGESAPVPVLRDLEQISDADCLVLPLPVTNRDGGLNTPFGNREIFLESVWPLVRPEQIICAGRVTPALAAEAAEYRLTLHDYYAREELAIANAVPTAEGAIQIAVEELPVTIQDAETLILGFGRIGKLLARRMAALGARVSVTARSCEELAWIEALGYTPVRFKTLSGVLDRYQLLFNTVPARVLSGEELCKLQQGAVCIDLASAPGGAGQFFGTFFALRRHRVEASGREEKDQMEQYPMTIHFQQDGPTLEELLQTLRRGQTEERSCPGGRDCT